LLSKLLTMRRRLLLILVSVFMGSAAIYGQTDKPKDTTLTFKYLISSDWTFTVGNLNSFITVNQAQFAVEQRVIGAKLLARYRYGELEKVTNNNEFYTNAELMFFPKNRVYGFVNGGAEFSFLRGINLRAWGGLGAGFKVLDSDDHKFEPAVSFNYEYNNYSAPVLYRGDSTTIVNTVNANIGWTGSHKFFKGKLVLVHNFNWTQDMLYAANYKFNGGFTLAVPIIKNLMVKTSLLGTYQNVVPVDKRQGDLIWTIGLAWGNI
jgi:hypothetical protein